MTTKITLLKFDWHHWIACPWEPPVRCMHASRWYLLYKTSYRRFCLKFRCHGNGVGRGRICLASFNSPTPKTPC